MTRKRRLGPAALEESRDLATIVLELLQVLRRRHAGDGSLGAATALVERFVGGLDARGTAPGGDGKPVDLASVR